MKLNLRAYRGIKVYLIPTVAFTYIEDYGGETKYVIRIDFYFLMFRIVFRVRWGKWSITL